MGQIRKIRKAFKSKSTLEGAGVHLHRAFGFNEVPLFDPFLLLDDFRNDRPEHYLKGFPWHPHRGIETITYVLRGDVEHGDSLGNKGIIGSGDVQWMTAGSGIIHQEMPKGDPHGLMWGFQLWANLPARHKMMAPRYRDVKQSQIPMRITPQGVTLRVICGRVEETTGPVEDIVIDPQYIDITVPAGTTYRHPTKRGHTVFVYVIEGHGYFCEERSPFTYDIASERYFDMSAAASAQDGTLLLFDDGDEIKVSTEESATRFLLIAGQPIGEPVAWYGPIVMNTQQELQTAFEEYQKGTFIK